jgi:hypothetical protein
MATSAQRLGGLPAAWRAAGAVGGSNAVYVLGAAMLAVEAAVHVQQFASIFHAVPWIGPSSWPTPRPPSWPRPAWPTSARGRSPP